MNDVTESDLLAAIRTAFDAREDGEDDCMTSYEIMKATGEPRRKIHLLLRELVHEGVVEVQRVRRINIVGVPQTVPGYRLVENDSNR